MVQYLCELGDPCAGSVGVGGHQASELAIWLESPAPPPLVHLSHTNNENITTQASDNVRDQGFQGVLSFKDGTLVSQGTHSGGISIT